METDIETLGDKDYILWLEKFKTSMGDTAQWHQGDVTCYMEDKQFIGGPNELFSDLKRLYPESKSLLLFSRK